VGLGGAENVGLGGSENVGLGGSEPVGLGGNENVGLDGRLLRGGGGGAAWTPRERARATGAAVKVVNFMSVFWVFVGLTE